MRFLSWKKSILYSPLIDITEIEKNDLNENLNSEISKEEIIICAKSLKNDKACGNDFIMNEYINSTCNQLPDIYVKLVNIIFKCGFIPESWILGTIKPFYKSKGNKYDPTNYRPITIVGCFEKMFTAILCNRLIDFSDELLLLSESQWGLWKGYSTTDCMCVLNSFVDILKLKKRNYVVHLSISKKYLIQSGTMV
jgi:hypothetical protein